MRPCSSVLWLQVQSNEFHWAVEREGRILFQSGWFINRRFLNRYIVKAFKHRRCEYRWSHRFRCCEYKCDDIYCQDWKEETRVISHASIASELLLFLSSGNTDTVCVEAGIWWRHMAHSSNEQLGTVLVWYMTSTTVSAKSLHHFCHPFIQLSQHFISGRET